MKDDTGGRFLWHRSLRRSIQGSDHCSSFDLCNVCNERDKATLNNIVGYHRSKKKPVFSPLKNGNNPLKTLVSFNSMTHLRFVAVKNLISDYFLAEETTTSWYCSEKRKESSSKTNHHQD